MSKRSKTLSLVVAGLAAAAIGITGCASGNNGGGEDAAEESTFVAVLGSNPPHLNPQLTTDVAASVVTSAIYETLVHIDSEYQISPALAESWTVSEDASEYSFTLREGVTWHDGEPFTSADVKFNLLEVIKLHPLGTFANDIASIETPDELTVDVTLTKPFAPFLAALSGHRMLPAHLYEGTDIVSNPTNLNPVGTGPFVLEKYTSGDRAVVVKNEDYWGETGDLDRIVFTIMPDSNARILALQSGDIDYINSIWLDTAQIDLLEQDEDLYFTSDGAQPSMMSLFINTRQGPLADPKVREAVYVAIDRESVAEDVFNGSAVPARGPVPAAVTWAVTGEVDFTEQFAYDPDTAAAMLDEAGFPVGADGSRFEVRIAAASGYPAFVATAEVIKSNLEAIGVKVSVESADLNIFAEKTFTLNDFDLGVMSASAYQDPNLGVSRLFVCNETNRLFANPSGICDPVIDEAFAAAGQVSDLEERAAHFETAEKRIAETLGTLPIVEELAISVMRQDKWEGIPDFNHYMWEDWTVISAK